MTFHPKPYRSDFTGKLQWYVHHRPTTIAVIVLAVFVPLGWWLTGSYSPWP